jgi:hypothetical protein
MKRIILPCLIAALAASAHAGLILSPVNAVGLPGSVTGWGYDISNPDPSNFMVLNDSFVSGSLSTGIFGNYVDYTASTGIVIAPGGDSGLVAFSRGVAGVGEFDFVQFVPVPTHIPGAINIDFSLFSEDPNSPSFDPGSFVSSGTMSASAAATVVPEPASELLLGLTLLLFGVVIWRRRQDRQR